MGLQGHRSRPSVRPSVMLMYPGHIGWTSAKVITRVISLGSSLLGAKIWGSSPKQFVDQKPGMLMRPAYGEAEAKNIFQGRGQGQ